MPQEEEVRQLNASQQTNKAVPTDEQFHRLLLDRMAEKSYIENGSDASFDRERRTLSFKTPIRFKLEIHQNHELRVRQLEYASGEKISDYYVEENYTREAHTAIFEFAGDRIELENGLCRPSNESSLDVLLRVAKAIIAMYGRGPEA